MSDMTDDLDWFDEYGREIIHPCFFCGQRVYRDWGILFNAKNDKKHDCREKAARVARKITKKFLRRNA